MTPTIEAKRPSAASVPKSTPSTMAGPAAGPSDLVKRTAPLWLSTLDVRYSTKPANLPCTPPIMAEMPAWPSLAISGSR